MRPSADAPDHGHRHAAFGVGLLHGLAGAGHFWAVLPSLALPPGPAAVYLTGYLAASLTTMTALGAALGRFAAGLGAPGLRRLIATAGAATLAVGLFWTWVAWA